MIKKYMSRSQWYKCCRRSTEDNEDERLGKDPRRLWSMVAVVNRWLLALAILDVTSQTIFQLPVIEQNENYRYWGIR